MPTGNATNQLPAHRVLPRCRTELHRYAPGALVFAFFALDFQRPIGERLAIGLGAAFAVTLIGILSMMLCLFVVARLRGDEAPDSRELDTPRFWAAILLFASAFIWAEIARDNTKRELLQCVTRLAPQTPPNELVSGVESCYDETAAFE